MTNPARLISDVIAEIADGVRRGQSFEFTVPRGRDGQLNYAGTLDGELNRTGIASSIPLGSRGKVFESILGAGVGEQPFPTTPEQVERGMTFKICGL